MEANDERVARPREAFSLLGHNIRLEIVLALLDQWEAAHTEPQRYSDLMRAVGLRDSGKFNYHLGKLRGAYLRKADGGYVPTASATALYRAVLAHRPTETLTRSHLSLDAECPTCNEPLTATYEREFFTLQCSSCDDVVDDFTYPLPKNGLKGRTDQEVLQTVYDRARLQVGLARTGQCPDCAGKVAITVHRDRLDEGSQPSVEIACDTCTWTVRTGFLLPLLTDAQVTTVLTNIGVAVTDKYPWKLPDPTPTASSTDPLRIRLVVEATDGTATILIDGCLNVLSLTENSINGTDE